jgi:type III restriction enzyme
MAFSLAREVCKRWESEQGCFENSDSTITPQVLFPKVAYAAKRFLLEKVICVGTAQPCDVLLVGKYQQAAVNALFEAIRKGGVCGNLELPRIAKGAAGHGSTEYVDYHTNKDVYPVTKCHLNLMAADTGKWEQSAGFALDAQPGVIKWVKNEHLGFTIPYRKNGKPATYIPDFIAELDSGLNLIIETKGQYNDNADIKAKAAERWVNAVNEAGNSCLWQYVVVKEPTALPNILNQYCLAKWDVSDLEFGT